MILRAGQLVAVAGLRQLDAGEDVGRRRRAQHVHVEARCRWPMRPARVRPYPRCSVSVSGAWPGASQTGMRSVRPPCFNSTTSPLIEREARRGARRDERGVVPRQLRERLRQLLQPGVVREAAVVHARVGAEDDLETLRRLAADCAPALIALQRHRLRRERRVRDQAVVQPPAPRAIESRLRRHRRSRQRWRRAGRQAHRPPPPAAGGALAAGAAGA